MSPTFKSSRAPSGVIGVVAVITLSMEIHEKSGCGDAFALSLCPRTRSPEVWKVGNSFPELPAVVSSAQPLEEAMVEPNASCL